MTLEISTDVEHVWCQIGDCQRKSYSAIRLDAYAADLEEVRAVLLENSYLWLASHSFDLFDRNWLAYYRLTMTTPPFRTIQVCRGKENGCLNTAIEWLTDYSQKHSSIVG